MNDAAAGADGGAWKDGGGTIGDTVTLGCLGAADSKQINMNLSE